MKMRLGLILIALIFLTKKSIGNGVLSDSLILDGFNIQMEEDTLDPNDPSNIDYWKQDIKPLPKTLIWFHSIGVIGGADRKGLELESNLPLLSTIDPQEQKVNFLGGLSWNSTLLLTNNIGFSLGLNYAQYHYQVLSASLPELNEDQTPYHLAIRDGQLQSIFKSEVGLDLFELDTINVPLSRTQYTIQNVQIPIMINYLYESKSDLWRFHGGMGVLVQHAQAPTLNYTFIENQYVSTLRAPSFGRWNSAPLVMLELDRSITSAHAIFLRGTGIWPSFTLRQEGVINHIPNYWISFGWIWKFNNNPYIRAR